MTQILEKILKKRQISDFSRGWIKNTTIDDNTIKVTYRILKKIGLSDSKIATQAQLLGRNPDTIERNYQNLSDLGLKDSKIASQAHLLSMNPNTIERNHQRLLDLGLKDSKIASKAGLLNMNPDTIEKNYESHIRLLKQNYQDRYFGKQILLQQAQLLGVSPETFEANVQWFAERNLDYGNGMLLGTKPQTKRKKLAWMLRELFDYREVPEYQRKETIRSMYNFVRSNPNLLLKSIKALEKVKSKLRGEVEFYNRLPLREV